MSNIERQKTIKQSVSLSGIGLHSGKGANITFKPACENTGIVFVRIDLPLCPKIPAVANSVSATVRATTLSNDGASIFTVEHVLAALFMCGIDNCFIEMDCQEPPVMDGSALEFIRLLSQAGIQEQSADRVVNILTDSFGVYDEDRHIIIVPYNGQRFSFLSINEHPLLGTQYFDIEVGKTDLLKEIAPARTIAFVHEVEGLKKMGLGLGGTMDNVIVYDKDKVLTPLRFDDELVRHKLLDLIGDLFLAGRFLGHVIAVKSGHALNARLASEIIKSLQKGAEK